MLLDCFMFYNEYDILEGRLEYLYDTVDYFIIVEMDITYNGVKKPMNFANNFQRYKKYEDKILYFPFSPDISNYDFAATGTTYNLLSPQWSVENAQRNHITKALQLFDKDDYVMISDVDEIPNKYGIGVAIPHLSHDDSIAFEQQMFYHNFDCLHRKDWPGSVITTVGRARDNTPQHYRLDRWGVPKIFGGGWHLSYWGAAERASEKIQNHAHQEFNTPELTDVDAIRQKIAAGQDILGRWNYTKIDPSLIDQEIYNIFNKYGYK